MIVHEQHTIDTSPFLKTGCQYCRQEINNPDMIRMQFLPWAAMGMGVIINALTTQSSLTGPWFSTFYFHLGEANFFLLHRSVLLLWNRQQGFPQALHTRSRMHEGDYVGSDGKRIGRALLPSNLWEGICGVPPKIKSEKQTTTQRRQDKAWVTRP